MADKLFEELATILRDRDVPYDREALKSVCRDPENQTAIREWMDEYLTPETLLTKDEAALYASLTKTGEFERLAAQDLSAVHGLNDSEIREAIEELRRSTAAIEKQSEALRLQQSAMGTLVKNNQRSSQARALSSNSQVKKWNVEREHVSRAIEDLSQNLEYQILDLEQQTKLSEVTVKQTVDSILKSDDKLLSSLQKLALDLDPIQTEDDDIIARIRELLIKHTVEGIRTKLDRIYLEALPSTGSNGPNNQESKDLQEELESLYSEILPVAQMSAEQQFLQPALRTISAKNGQGQERAVKAVKYIHQCLTFLVSRLEAFFERAEEDQCHRMALKVVLDTAKTELSRVVDSPPPPTPSKSFTHERRASLAVSGIKTRNSRRRLSGMDDEDIDPEQQLAQNLGITLPADTATDQERVKGLEQILTDRITKLDIHSSSLQTTTENSISSHLLDSQLTLQLLQDSLLAETLYHKVRLLDPDIESSVSMFQQEIVDLQESLDDIDLQQLLAKNVNREQIIERWGR
ncbi:hypothetical protein HYFRA_00005484 [Hymenoscyphus fraxineus]|uniref:Vacuolar H+/Ca2+ exchanger n=1 Tax=Hymenoscyphus fraxineus TaxID=746836 RepID=A0A9N9KQM1_9HELO|nr:hypothetical protein HYFRA_00005484 [Hymenoscyphus fraxineus]